jgi:putative glutamine amidotransferase
MAVGEKYLRPLIAIGARPRLLPALTSESAEDLLDGLDGLMLTGAISNIEPEHYGLGPDAQCPPLDPARDHTVLPLITACLARDLPLLAICRGLQELNVALGGSLHPRLHEVAGRLDHRAAEDLPQDQQYAPRHSIRLSRDGLLIGLNHGNETVMVNSLHGQGIDRLGRNLVVEAIAEDGTIEAVRVAGGNFALGLQWHPEWNFTEIPLSLAIFDKFRQAIEGHRQNR